MPLILDTDIGSDVDDALALAVLIGSPEINLTAVTTVYGDTLLRARMASRLIRIADKHASIRVASGEQLPISGRSVWWAGHEGALFDNLHDEETSTEDAVDLLIRSAREYAGELDILAIGPLTNIAAAIDRDPSFVSNVKGLYIMGGDFSKTHRRCEHNFVCDAVAAQKVMSSGMAIYVMGLDVTEQVQLSTNEVEAMTSIGELGELLKKEIHQFWQFHGKSWNNPHDASTAVFLVRPELFTTTPWHVVINDTANESVGAVIGGSCRDGETANVLVIDGVNAEAVKNEIVTRIRNATTRGL